MCAEKKRSIGLTILGICGLLISIISLAILIYINIKNKELFTVKYNIFSFFYVLSMFVASVGIILLKSWARTLLIILLFIKIVGSIVKLIILNNKGQIRPVHFLEQGISIIIILLIIYFLYRKATIDQFI
jgi:hypothetical protein